jgi:hypothetical protein
MEIIVNIALIVAAAYLLSGFVFAIAFLAKGIAAVDEGAVGSTIGFRIIIMPGVIVFWPFLLTRWRKASKENQTNQHNE